MNPAIREKRKITIDSTIITPKIIRRIASVIDREVTQVSNEKNLFQNYSIDAFDDSSYESQSVAIFNDLMDTKTLEHVSMQFYTADQSKKIEVQFHHSPEDANTKNFISVSGDDSVWVNGVLAQFSEIIETSESRSGLRSVIGYAVFPALVIINVYYFHFFYALIQTNKYGWIEGLMTLWLPALSIYIMSKAKEYLDDIFPDVELQTGHDYQQIPASKRKRIAAVATLFIIPILTAFIYDLLKNWLHVW